ncbi:polysaccharide deacetylase family protein [[Clostridium] colinum]|uniref:polysaccharide deacetylase family protein n=1 Tax=[Clostridium] colinum TaxID=36835 RepID=UPI002024551E|nr:polysaccharide deacetylase family protein [[Clostridium] colinum]
MKKLNFFAFIIIIISIIAIPVTSIGNVNDDIKESESKYYSNINKNELKYEFKKLEKYDTSLIYKIKYPVFNNDTINQEIYKHIEYLADSFKEDFSNYEAIYNEDKMNFKLDTEISIFNNKILFVKFIIERNYNTYPNPIKFYETYAINIEENKEIQIPSLFNNGYEDLFFMNVKQYFLNTYGINITKQSENYNDIKPDKNNYKKVFFNDKSVEIFFYDYKKQEEILLKIPIDKVLPYIKKYYLEQETVTTTKETTLTSTTETTTETTTISIKSTTTTTVKDIKTGNKSINKRKIDKNKPMVALTFDDGPNGATTTRILDILEKNNSVATFFIVSRRIDKDADILKRMVNLGCQIGNHTANHKDLTKLSTEQVKSEVDIVNNKLKNIIGKEASMVRVPYGAANSNVKKTVNYPLIMWNIDTKDWQTKNAKSIEKAILNNVKDGDIILMHDLYTSTADACEVVIPQLVKQGFQLVTVEELLYYKEIEVKEGLTYFNARTKK